MEAPIEGAATSGAAAKETQQSQLQDTERKLWSMHASVWELQDQLETNGVSCGWATPLLSLLQHMGADEQIVHLEMLIGRMQNLLLWQVQPAAASKTVLRKEVSATFKLPAGRRIGPCY